MRRPPSTCSSDHAPSSLERVATCAAPLSPISLVQQRLPRLHRRQTSHAGTPLRILSPRRESTMKRHPRWRNVALSSLSRSS
eukprot:1061081-Pleurochrysis_carterae.AAC.1